MIRLQDMTPEVYYRESRDFQFIGRLYDLVLNYIKMETDQIDSLPLSQNSDDKLLDLMMMTLGFQSRHNYNIKQLRALCGSFVEIMHYKGSLTALDLACKTLLNAEGITDEAVIEFESVNEQKDYSRLIIYISDKLSDTNLLKDLLDYILPAGMSANIIRRKIVTLEDDANTQLVYIDETPQWVATTDGNIAIVVNPNKAVSGFGGDYDRSIDTEKKNSRSSNDNSKYHTGYIVNSMVVDTAQLSDTTGETEEQSNGQTKEN